MNDLRQALRERDPVGQEPSMSASDVQRMRATVLSAAGQLHERGGWWPQPIVVAATLILACGAGIMLAHRFPAREIPGPAAVEASAPVRRQLQFETKGGTRVIWVLNSELDLGKDPLP
jgi:hypothetical protein